MKQLFVSISVKQDLFVSVFVHKCLMMLNNNAEYTAFKIFGTQMNKVFIALSFSHSQGHSISGGVNHIIKGKIH